MRNLVNEAGIMSVSQLLNVLSNYLSVYISVVLDRTLLP